MAIITGKIDQVVSDLTFMYNLTDSTKVVNHLLSRAGLTRAWSKVSKSEQKYFISSSS